MGVNNILVVGGLGAMGSALIPILFKKFPDADIYNIDNGTNARDDSILLKFRNHKNYHELTGDIFGVHHFRIPVADWVINLVEASPLNTNTENNSCYSMVNVYGHHILLDYCTKRGSNVILIANDTENITSVYDATKQAAEDITDKYSDEFTDTSIIILKIDKNLALEDIPEVCDSISSVIADDISSGTYKIKVNTK